MLEEAEGIAPNITERIVATPQREAYLRQERDLGRDLAEQLALVRADARFASMMRKTAEASGRKMLRA